MKDDNDNSEKYNKSANDRSKCCRVEFNGKIVYGRAIRCEKGYTKMMASNDIFELHRIAVLICVVDSMEKIKSKINHKVVIN